MSFCVEVFTAQVVLMYTLAGTCLQLQLGPSPVSPLGVISNGVTSPHSNPLRNRTILPLSLGEFPLDDEGFVRCLDRNK